MSTPSRTAPDVLLIENVFKLIGPDCKVLPMCQHFILIVHKSSQDTKLIYLQHLFQGLNRFKSKTKQTWSLLITTPPAEKVQTHGIMSSHSIHTNVMRERAWFICHTFSSSYSSRAAWNCAGVKPRDTQRCSASATRTDLTAPSPASSRSREKITSAGRCALQTDRE